MQPTCSSQRVSPSDPIDPRSVCGQSLRTLIFLSHLNPKDSATPTRAADKVSELVGKRSKREKQEEKESEIGHLRTSSKVGSGDCRSYLQFLVRFQGPDGGVSEFDVVQSLVRCVFVDLATGEPVAMLLCERCHFYN